MINIKNIVLSFRSSFHIFLYRPIYKKNGIEQEMKNGLCVYKIFEFFYCLFNMTVNHYEYNARGSKSKVTEFQQIMVDRYISLSCSLNTCKCPLYKHYCIMYSSSIIFILFQIDGGR